METFSALLALFAGNSPVTGEFPLLTNASEAELWCFLWSALEQTVESTNETPVIWDAIALIMTSLQRVNDAFLVRLCLDIIFSHVGSESYFEVSLSRSIVLERFQVQVWQTKQNKQKHCVSSKNKILDEFIFVNEVGGKMGWVGCCGLS